MPLLWPEAPPVAAGTHDGPEIVRMTSKIMAPFHFFTEIEETVDQRFFLHYTGLNPPGEFFFVCLFFYTYRFYRILR